MIDVVLFVLMMLLFVICFALLRKLDKLEKTFEESKSYSSDRRNNLEVRIEDLEKELNGYSSIWMSIWMWNDKFYCVVDGVRGRLDVLEKENGKHKALLNEVIDEVYRDNK